MHTAALFSSTTLLWLAGALIAFFLLMGSMSKRHLSLTELLRRYVSKNQGDFEKSPPEAAAKKPDSSTKTPPQSS